MKRSCHITISETPRGSMPTSAKNASKNCGFRVSCHAPATGVSTIMRLEDSSTTFIVPCLLPACPPSRFGFEGTPAMVFTAKLALVPVLLEPFGSLFDIDPVFVPSLGLTASHEVFRQDLTHTVRIAS